MTAEYFESPDLAGFEDEPVLLPDTLAAPPPARGSAAAGGSTVDRSPLELMRDQFVAAHLAALAAQRALQERVLVELARGGAGRVPRNGYSLSANLELSGTELTTVDGQVSMARLIAAGRWILLMLWARVPDLPDRELLLGGQVLFHDRLPVGSTKLHFEACVAAGPAADPTIVMRCTANEELLFEVSGAPREPVRPGPAPTVPDRTSSGRAGGLVPAGVRALAGTARTRLDSADLDLLTAGRVPEVFGPAFDQDGCNRSLRLPAGPGRLIDEVVRIDRAGGTRSLGRISARGLLSPDCLGMDDAGDPVSAPQAHLVGGAWHVLQVYALALGLHLCLPDARFEPVAGRPIRLLPGRPVQLGTSPVSYQVDITQVDLVPRPHILADIDVYQEEVWLLGIRDLGVMICEKPEVLIGPGPGGVVAGFLGRKNGRGERALLNELHAAHSSKGDLSLALGPEFRLYQNRRAPHLPNGELLFVDRVMAFEGERGRLAPGSTLVTEYDSPVDAWYYRENGHPFMPNVVYLETSLQSALVLGYYLGATLQFPEEDFILRNLDGHTTLVRDIDPRGRTIRQRTTLLSSTPTSGSILQSFAFELSIDGEPFYTGESLFGFFNQRAMANQTGLDGGEYLPPWLDGRPELAASARRIDLSSRSSAGAGLALGTGRLALVDWVDVVGGGGSHGRGFIRGGKAVDPGDWYFARHFYQDPVMPGSLGVESVIQAVQAYVIDQGLAAGIPEPSFAMAVGETVSWRYRGQILGHDERMDFDAHIRDVRRDQRDLVVTADASVWRPGLRIYEVSNLSVRVRPGGGPAPAGGASAHPERRIR